MKRIILSVIIAAAILAGCGGGSPVAYRPIAYGENNQCYYVNSPAEVITLQAQGLCDRSWAPTLMPLLWHQRYWNYYSSPSYYSVYVPVASRSVYITTERTWGSNNRAAIATASREATYRGSNGKTVPASKIGAAKYGGGSRFGPVGTKFGGGSARTGGAPSPSVKAPSSPAPSKGYSGSSGGSGRPSSGGGSHSFGGGSGRPSSGGSSHSFGGGGGSHSFGGGGGRR